MEIRVDHEFESRIPPLTEEEFRNLEKNILTAGEIYSPIIVWNGMIVDGHNRYRILKGHPELTWSVKEMDFENRDEAMGWICGNQLGRRNLTPMQKKYLIGIQYNAQKNSHGGSRRGAPCSSDKNDHLKKETTRQRLAREHGVSEAYIQHCADYAEGINIAESIKPGIGKKITGGEVKVTQSSVEQIVKIPEADRTDYVVSTVANVSSSEEKYRKSSGKTSGKTLGKTPRQKNAPLIDDKVAIALQRALEKFLDTWENIFEENEDWIYDHEAFCKYMIGSCGNALEKIADEYMWYFFEDEDCSEDEE